MATRLRIKDTHSPDVEHLTRWRPEDPSVAHLLVELTIGDDEAPGGDNFQVVVATPAGLLAHKRPDAQVLSDRATIVLSEYSWPVVREHLEAIVERCAAPSWSDSVLKLQRYFSWEYEDYPMISHERFHARLAAGLAQGLPYSSPLKAGFIQVWRHEDVIFLTWEEYVLRDAQKVRLERREFSSTEEAVDWLETQGIDAARFGP